MTTKAQREVLLQGQDAMCNMIVALLVAQGWSNDGILKNLLSKEYPPHHAAIWVELDSDNQLYYLKGEYVSKGDNVLISCLCYIKADSSPAEVAAAVEAYLADAENQIHNSFAVRFIGNSTSMGPRQPRPPCCSCACA